MFGRRKDDEDPFAALKDGGTYQSQPTTVPDIGAGGLPGQSGQSATAPSVSASPGVAAAPPPIPLPPTTSLGSLPAFRPRRSRRFGGSGTGPMILLRLAIPAVVIAAIAIPAINVGHSIHSFSIPPFSTPSSIPATPAPAPAPSVSYLTPRGRARRARAHLEAGTGSAADPAARRWPLAERDRDPPWPRREVDLLRADRHDGDGHGFLGPGPDCAVADQAERCRRGWWRRCMPASTSPHPGSTTW